MYRPKHKAKIRPLLEENTGENLSNYGLGKDFLNRSEKAIYIQKKKLGHHQYQKFCFSKDNVKRKASKRKYL